MESLPRGRHGLSREFIAEHQRERLLEAIFDLLERRGYEHMTVAAIAAEAGVSKSDFYAHFGSKDAGFLAAYDAAVDDVRAAVRGACAAECEWAAGVWAGLGEALAVLAAAPGQASLLLVEGLRIGPELHARFQALVAGFAPRLREGAPGIARDASRPLLADEAVVGAIASLAGSRVLAGEAARLGDFLPDFAEFALTQYLGGAEARRIISAR